jgi:predicted house-cleaning noncanonical NTP pyrophosphatase (MazG superfamily)
MEKVGKLVRDRVIGCISSKGEIPHWSKIEKDEAFLEALFKKLEEETREVRGAPNPEERLLECVDVAEVLIAILTLQGTTRQQFIRALLGKRKEWGAFQERILLESVETPHSESPRPDRAGYHVFSHGHE